MSAFAIGLFVGCLIGLCAAVHASASGYSRGRKGRKDALDGWGGMDNFPKSPKGVKATQKDWGIR